MRCSSTSDAGQAAAFLHQDENMAGRGAGSMNSFRDVLAEAVEAGAVRREVSSEELANYCLPALAAASGLRPRPTCAGWSP